MKLNTPPAPAAPVPARTRAAKTQPAQASLFAPEPAEPVPALTRPPAKPRGRAAAPRLAAAAPAAGPAKAGVKIAKTNSAPDADGQAPAQASSKAAKPKNAKTNSGVKPAVPREQPVRIVSDPVFEGGSLWKMSGKNGVAYVRDAALAGELLAVDPKKLAQAAMAVYYDKKGKAFAWQVRFDTDRWDELLRRLG